MRIMMAAFQKVHVVGRNQIEVHLAGNFDQLGIAAALGVKVVIVQLNEEILPSEDIPVLARHFARPGRVTGAEALVHLTLEASAQRDEPAGVGGEKFLVHPGLVVEALEMGRADQFDQIAIALVVGGEQGQVEGRILGRSGITIRHRARCNVGLAAHEGLHAGFFRSLIKFHRPVEIAMIGHGHGGHTEFHRLPGQILRADGPVEEGILRVTVQVDERCGSHQTCTIKWARRRARIPVDASKRNGFSANPAQARASSRRTISALPRRPTV